MADILPNLPPYPATVAASILSHGAYKKESIEGFTKLAGNRDPLTGVYAFVYQDVKTKENYLVFRGSDNVQNFAYDLLLFIPSLYSKKAGAVANAVSGLFVTSSKFLNLFLQTTKYRSTQCLDSCSI